MCREMKLWMVYVCVNWCKLLAWLLGCVVGAFFWPVSEKLRIYSPSLQKTFMFSTKTLLINPQRDTKRSYNTTSTLINPANVHPFLEKRQANDLNFDALSQIYTAKFFDVCGCWWELVFELEGGLSCLCCLICFTAPKIIPPWHYKQKIFSSPKTHEQ